MATLGQVKNRIADELARADLTSQIALALESAVAFYQREPFGFNEGTATVSVTGPAASFAVSSVDTTLSALRHIVYTEGTNRYPMRRITVAEWLDQYQATTEYGVPLLWTIHQETVQFWPGISQTRSFIVYYNDRASLPSQDADSNYWTTEAEELIRLHAKVDLLENVIRGEGAFAEADRLRGREAQVLSGLRAETGRILGSGRVVAYTL